MIKHGWELSDKDIAQKYQSVANKRHYDIVESHQMIKRMIHVCVSHGWLSREKRTKLLDLGCGTGVLLESLCSIFKGWECLGIDPSYPEEKPPKVIMENGILYHGSAYNIKAKTSSMDLIIMSDIIEHLNRPDDALREVARVLNRQGVVILTVPNGTAFIGWKLWEKLLPFSWANKRLLPSEHPKRTWQPIDTLYEYNEILALLNKNKFEILAMSSTQFIPPILYSAPILGRFYKKYNLDKLMSKIFPIKFGYRLILVAQKTADNVK